MAYYKARVKYQNPDWKDGEDNVDLEYFQTQDIKLPFPPNIEGDVLKEHSVAMQIIPMFWSGQIAVQVGKGKFMHPGRIVSVEIVENIEIATVSPEAVQEAVAKNE